MPAGTVAVTAAVRFAMLPWLGDKPPLILFAVIAAAWALCATYGWLIARLAALIGGVRQP